MAEAHRRRRHSGDAARRNWYARWRAWRFARHYFGHPIPEVSPGR